MSSSSENFYETDTIKRNKVGFYDATLNVVVQKKVSIKHEVKLHK